MQEIEGDRQEWAYLAPFVALGELALRRHDQQRAGQPKRSAAPYLRAALGCARALMRQSRHHPAAQVEAARLVLRVIDVAHAVEESGNGSAAYITLLITAEEMRLVLYDALHPSAASSSRTDAQAPSLTARPLHHGKQPKPGRHQTAFANLHLPHRPVG